MNFRDACGSCPKIEERNIDKIKIYLVKKTKIKIQNKYVFRTIISEFLYFFLKAYGSSMVARPKCLGLAWLSYPSMSVWFFS